MKLHGEQITRAMSAIAELMWEYDLAMYCEMFVRHQQTVAALGEDAARAVGYEHRTQKEFLDLYYPEGGTRRKAARDMIRRYQDGRPRKNVSVTRQALSDIFHHVTRECELPSLGQLGYSQGSAIYVRASETLGEVKAAFEKGEKSS